VSETRGGNDDNRGEWRRAGLFTLGLLAATAAVWAAGGQTVGEAWQAVFGAFSTVVSVGTAAALWLVGCWLVWHTLRCDCGAERWRGLLWGVVALAIAGVLTWSVVASVRGGRAEPDGVDAPNPPL
jgi:hypothetical protein